MLWRWRVRYRPRFFFFQTVDEYIYTKILLWIWQNRVRLFYLIDLLLLTPFRVDSTVGSGYTMSQIMERPFEPINVQRMTRSSMRLYSADLLMEHLEAINTGGVDCKISSNVYHLFSDRFVRTRDHSDSRLTSQDGL